MCALLLSYVWYFVTLWNVACQAPFSMGLSTNEYWSGLPFLLPRDLSNPGIEPVSPALAERFFSTGPLSEDKVDGLCPISWKVLGAKLRLLWGRRILPQDCSSRKREVKHRAVWQLCKHWLSFGESPGTEIRP